jgi:hypothetical protein
MKPGKLAISACCSSPIDPELSMTNRKSTLRQPFPSPPVDGPEVSSAPTSSFGKSLVVVGSSTPELVLVAAVSLSPPLPSEVPSVPVIDTPVVGAVVIVALVAFVAFVALVTPVWPEAEEPTSSPHADRVKNEARRV